MSSKQQLTVAGLVLVFGSPVAGQPLDSDVLAVLQGPRPPVAPEVVSRDAQGRATVRATRLRAPLQIDGRLDEPVYETVQYITDFIQQLPDEGALGSERTEVWVLFDDDSIYISARCYDTAPPSEWVANEMRRDVIQLRQNDSFSLMLDTFYDRRNGLAFLVTPIGGFSDFAISNEGGRVNTDWNTIWDSRTDRFDGGWTVEIEIPFKSLRYRPTSTQVWGIQLRRIIRRRTEASYLTPLPISAARGNSVIAGLWRVSQAGSLVGIEVPSGSRKIEIKPYGIGGMTTDSTADPPTRNALDGQFGLDVKYGVTRNLTADFTYNTDFAQVEVDEQQVNLTRFSLFFPEKREFFLEGRGNFDFARGAGLGGAGTPTLFFSRRIGLQGSDVVPILAGGRLTGKVGAFDVGALNIQTGDELRSGAQTTNFTVLRVKRDILRRSTIGGIFTNRSVSLVGDGSNQVYGLDGRFAFFDDVNLLGYVARTSTRGRRGRDASYLGRFSYAGDRYGFDLGHLVIEDNFNPEIGFVRRDNIRRTTASGRFSPRPRSIDWVRRFSLSGGVDYIVAADNRLLETRTQDVELEIQLENSDRFTVSAVDRYERLTTSFTIAPGVTLPVGGYDFRDVGAAYSFGQQRPLSGSISVRTGSFWSGDSTSVGLSRGRIEVTPQLSVEPSLSFNWVHLPEGAFTTSLSRVRVNYSVTPRMFFSGLLQHNSSGNTFSTNIRLRWEYSPGSELFVVYTEDRDTDPFLPDRRTELRNRGFVVKMNRLFRF
ncbi:MAG: carbohydrate binding family 9 domain-containing protein [Acidobacteria bacterium]|nr:carbohydrate binding family 9 domain-containing protein [Acidobacteriota bacterium]